MKISVGKNSLRFIICIGLLVLMYILIVGIFSYSLPRTVAGYRMTPSLFEGDYRLWKALLYHCLPVVLAILAYAFYTIQIKVLYIMTSIFMFNWLFEWIGQITILSTETVLILVYGVLLSVMVITYPLVDYVFFKKKKFKIGYLIFSFLITIGSDFVLLCYNKYFFPYQNVYCFVIKEAIILFILLITIYTLYPKDKLNVEKVVIGIFLILTLVCLFMTGLIAKQWVECSIPFSTETNLILITGMGVLTFIFLCPLVAHFFSKKVQVGYLIFLYLTIIGGDIILFLCNEKVLPYNHEYYLILKSVIIMFMVFVTTYMLRMLGNLNEVTFNNSILLIFLILISICLIIMGLYVMQRGFYFMGLPSVRTEEVIY